MKLLKGKTPWYVAGLAFECTGCGRCCSGPEEGYVWANEMEIAAIADYLGISVDEMHRRFIRRSNGRFTIKEDSQTRDCVFLQLAGNGGKSCIIYPVRPTQCRTWPFWPSNVKNPECWSQTAKRCPGINRGKLYALDEIRKNAEATE